MDPTKLLHIIDPKNCDNITLIEYIHSIGETILPMLLISKVNILLKQCQHKNLDRDIVIGITEICYANNNTALEFY